VFFQGLENLAKYFPRLGKFRRKNSKLWKSEDEDDDEHEDDVP
jgi:hypothetical protein